MINEYPVINYVDLEFYRPDNGFIVGKSKIGRTALKPATGGYKWVSYLGKATNVSVTRGGKEDGVTFNAEVGTLSVTMVNSANPMDQPNIKPNVPVRLRHIATGANLFLGTIVDINTAHKFDKSTGQFTDFVTITAVDAVQQLANTMRYGVLVEPQKFGERITTLGQSTTVPFNPGGDPLNYQMGATVYEGSLSAHLDLACNTVGARWYVTTQGTVVAGVPAVQSKTSYTVNGVFTDSGYGNKYVDIETAYDTRVMVNDLNLTQHDTKQDDDGNTVADDTTSNFKAPQSVIDYGARSANMDVNFYSIYDTFNRANDLFAKYANPFFRVTKVRWNVQEAQADAAKFDVNTAIEIRFRGTADAYTIINLSHDITPERWIVTYTVNRAY